MSTKSVTIAKIGEIGDLSTLSHTNKIFGDEFNFERKNYKLLLDINIQKVLKDVSNVSAFKLQNMQMENVESLWLTFWPQLMLTKNRSARYLRSTHSIVETFFIIEREFLFDETDEGPEHIETMRTNPIEMNQSNIDNNDNNSPDQNIHDESDEEDDNDQNDILPSTIIDDFYQQLREAHSNDQLVEYSDEYIQHIKLRPRLTKYQMNGIKWMLNRERKIDHFPTEFKEVKRRWWNVSSPLDEEVFLYNARTFILKTGKNSDIPIPSGGILADAMGLGKTVEMIDLILLNAKVPEKPIKTEAEGADEDIVMFEDVDNQEQLLKCFCPNKTIKKDTVICNRCLTLQHRSCVAQQKSRTPDEQYICPNCWPKEPLLNAKTTLIVSPESIKLQWRDEVIKHVNDDNFKILVYNGIKNEKWINPVELATYDIILTDYKTLQREFYYSNYNSTTRQLRKPAQYLVVKSSLLYINWWRVCLDEAQMFSSTITKPARLVAQLSAVHRWGVTGTPIQKSVDDLYGLMWFLGCSPYDEREKWSTLVDDFNYRANIKPLLTALRPIMWRTCKSKDVIAQINIPEQTHLVVNIDMMDLEQFHYNAEHSRCLQAFTQNAQKIGSKRKLSALNPHILKIVLEPLRKLRQDCTIPSVSERGMQKKSLKPEELLTHLTSVNENDAKQELRTITSSLNGIAAIQMIKGEVAEAIKMYKKVLKWAKEYNEKISVDSLLQIHAISNLLSIDTKITDDERTNYESDLIAFEKKFLSKNVLLVQNLITEKNKWSKRISEIELEFNANAFQWWIDALEYERVNPSQLLRRIQEDMFSSYNIVEANFQSTQGLQLILTLWLDKVFDERKNVLEQFNKLKFYIENFKPLAEIDENDRDKMLTFLHQASECHLDLEEFKVQPKRNKRKKIMPCKLCTTRIQLQTYECVIFDKRFADNANELDPGAMVRGSWKPSFQECILKAILSHIRSIDIDNKEDGKTLMQFLDALKSEFKELSQFWVEVNHTVSAYDEIKMCKSRTQVIDPVELEDESMLESNLVISKYEVDEKMAVLEVQMQQAEMSFIRKLGKLRYLNHLRKTNEVENCPVCKSKPEHKYVMLECGHHICYKCYIGWKSTKNEKHSRNNYQFNRFLISCFICRHKQSHSELFFVSLTTDKRLTDSSSKIEMIVQKVIELKKIDPNVKIVIFSQWSNILSYIEMAMISTNISFRSKLERFHQTIQQFKDPDLNVTCLLLPLSYGSKGLNLIEATHVFLIEPILDPGEELQAIGRIHRIGQTKKTYVHRFIINNTIEESIYQTVSKDKNGFWSSKKCTIEHLTELFTAQTTEPVYLDQNDS